jgi:hypothetical protein
MFPTRLRQPASASRTIDAYQETLPDLVARPVICLGASLPRLVALLVQVDLRKEFILSEFAACPTSQRVVSALHRLKARAGRSLATEATKAKEVPRREARHPSVRGRSSRRVLSRASSLRPRRCAPWSSSPRRHRALSAGRAAGDDPVSPGGHDPARLMDLVTPPLLSPREWQSHPSAAATGSRTVRARAPSGAPGFHPSGPA